MKGFFANVYDVTAEAYIVRMGGKQTLIDALDNASAGLEDVSTSLNFAEVFADASVASKLENYRSKLVEMAEKLALPGTAIKNYQAAMKILEGVNGLRGKIRDNPQAAAIAFGKLFSGIGELAKYLPPPINGYFGIFADAENFFETLRVKTQPEVHFKERGLREVIDNL